MLDTLVWRIYEPLVSSLQELVCHRMTPRSASRGMCLWVYSTTVKAVPSPGRSTYEGARRYGQGVKV